jgi:hypothetical protein
MRVQLQHLKKWKICVVVFLFTSVDETSSVAFPPQYGQRGTALVVCVGATSAAAVRTPGGF